jgi:glucose/arabinose dehydrogenase
MKKNHIAFVLTILLMTVGSACGQNTRETTKTSASTAASPTSTQSCAPLETKPANAPEQKPAFPGQTRACAVNSNVAFDVTVLAKGLDRPWVVDFS